MEAAPAGAGAGVSNALSAAEPQPDAVSLATMPALVWGLQRPALKAPPRRRGSEICIMLHVSLYSAVVASYDRLGLSPHLEPSRAKVSQEGILETNRPPDNSQRQN